MGHAWVVVAEVSAGDLGQVGYHDISELLDELAADLATFGGRDAAVELATALVKAVRDYFAREEVLMELCPGYGDAFGHRFAHFTFLARLEQLAAGIARPGPVAMEEVASAQLWWHSHAEDEDGRFRRHLERQFASEFLAAE